MGVYLAERDKNPIINKFVNGDYSKGSSIFKGAYLEGTIEENDLLKSLCADIDAKLHKNEN